MKIILLSFVIALTSACFLPKELVFPFPIILPFLTMTAPTAGLGEEEGIDFSANLIASNIKLEIDSWLMIFNIFYS